MSDLKPCPFCGEHLVENNDHHGKWLEHKDIFAYCPCAVNQLHTEDDYKQWNTRPIEDALRKELAEVKLQHDGNLAILNNTNKWLKWCDIKVLEQYEKVKSELATARAEIERLKSELGESPIISNTAKIKKESQ